MTIQTETARSGPYAGAGTAGPFTVGFRFLSSAHLRVIRTSSAGVDATLVLNTDYTVSGVGAASGTVTLVAVLAAGEKLTIIRDVPFTQLADYVAGDSFPAESHEDALDLLTMQTQQLKDDIGRSLTLPATSVGASTELPSAAPASLIGWDATGQALQNYDASSLGIAIASSSWRTDVFNGTGAQTAFVLTEDPFSASNCDVSVGGVTQIAGVNFSYTVATRTITFLTGAPVAGTGNVAVRYGQAAPLGVPSDLSVTTGKIADDSVTFPKLQNIATATILGRSTAGTGDVEALTGAQAGQVVGGNPAGTVIYVAMNAAPTGYIKANGAAIDRTTFAALFAAIGTTFGAGNGTTTFNVPDLRGEFIRGWDDGRGVDSGRGIGTAQAGEIQSHTHTLPGSFFQGGSGSGIGAGGNATIAGASINATGGTETRPRNVALLACIKF